MEQSNIPRYVKNTRRMRELSSSSDSETSHILLSSSATEKDSDSSVRPNKNKKLTKKKKLVKKISLKGTKNESVNNKTSCESEVDMTKKVIHNDIMEKLTKDYLDKFYEKKSNKGKGNELINNKKSIKKKEFTKNNSKTLLTSFEKNEHKEKIIKNGLSKITNPIFEFNEHVPRWGARFKYKGNNVNVTNTCTVDYFLFGFWVLSKIVHSRNFRNIPEINKTEVLKDIITNINVLNWNKVRELWIFNIIGNNERKRIF